MMSRSYEYRNGIKNSIKLSYTYRGLMNTSAIATLNTILDDYVLTGTPYINVEITINSIKIISKSKGCLKNTVYKFIINLYNNSTMGDSFILAPVITPTNM